MHAVLRWRSEGRRPLFVVAGGKPGVLDHWLETLGGELVVDTRDEPAQILSFADGVLGVAATDETAESTVDVLELPIEVDIEWLDSASGAL
jgi:hypothetical protein